MLTITRSVCCVSLFLKYRCQFIIENIQATCIVFQLHCVCEYRKIQMYYELIKETQLYA